MAPLSDAALFDIFDGDEQAVKHCLSILNNLHTPNTEVGGVLNAEDIRAKGQACCIEFGLDVVYMAALQHLSQRIRQLVPQSAVCSGLLYEQLVLKWIGGNLYVPFLREVLNSGNQVLPIAILINTVVGYFRCAGENGGVVIRAVARAGAEPVGIGVQLCGWNSAVAIVVQSVAEFGSAGINGGVVVRAGA